MVNHIRQYKDRRAYAKHLKECSGCTATAELKGYMQALLYAQGIDPIKAVTPNPGKVNMDYMTIHIRGKNTTNFIKWFVGILVGVGTFYGIITVLRGMFGI